MNPEINQLQPGDYMERRASTSRLNRKNCHYLVVISVSRGMVSFLGGFSDKRRGIRRYRDRRGVAYQHDVLRWGRVVRRNHKFHISSNYKP